MCEQKDCGIITNMQFVEPRPMDQGQQSVHFFSAFNEMVPPLRFKTNAPVLLLVSLDNALFSSLFRRINARKTFLYQNEDVFKTLRSASLELDEAGFNFELLKHTDFILGVPCKLHGWSLGTKWGCRPWDVGMVMDDLYITIESLRNSIG